nr:immunoglobulin light chain junction region [Macaca mulatta]
CQQHSTWPQLTF